MPSLTSATESPKSSRPTLSSNPSSAVSRTIDTTVLKSASIIMSREALSLSSPILVAESSQEIGLTGTETICPRDIRQNYRQNRIHIATAVRTCLVLQGIGYLPGDPLFYLTDILEHPGRDKDYRDTRVEHSVRQFPLNRLVVISGKILPVVLPSEIEPVSLVKDSGYDVHVIPDRSPVSRIDELPDAGIRILVRNEHVVGGHIQSIISVTGIKIRP